MDNMFIIPKEHLGFPAKILFDKADKGKWDSVTTIPVRIMEDKW